MPQRFDHSCLAYAVFGGRQEVACGHAFDKVVHFPSELVYRWNVFDLRRLIWTLQGDAARIGIGSKCPFDA